MNQARPGRGHWICASLAVLVACTGSGSDIGPSFPVLPAGTCKATVRDNQGLGVSGAVVRVADGVGVTGRTGRAELYGDRRGTRLVRVDASNASAKDTDRLVSLAFEAAVQGPDLPDAIYLPDTSASVSLTVGTGAALPATDLDDTANSGAVLRLAAGTFVSDGGNASVQLRIGELARERLPSPLPAAPAGSWLCTRSFWVDPPTATFAPAAALIVPDELALGTGNCVLFRLEPVTGQWQQVVGAAAGSGGSIQLANGIATGGLHVYAVATTSATVRGRVLDADDRPILSALVRVDSAMANTGTDGRFETVVAGIDAAGATRDVAFEIMGGGSWLPIVATGATGPLGAGVNVDLGDLTLETMPVGNVRAQIIRRGRPVSSIPIAMSGGLQAATSSAYTDSVGQCTLEDMPAGWFGTTVTAPLSGTSVTTAEILSFLDAGARVISSRYYLSDRSIASDNRSTRLLALDVENGGPAQGAAIVRGRVANEGSLGLTRESGVIVADRTTFDRLTATLRTTVGAASTTSAFSFEGASGNRVELPLVREQKIAPGAFDRHGVVKGSLVGADPAREQVVFASRPLDLSEWFRSRMQGAASPPRMPVRLGGVLQFGDYGAGVAQPLGNVTVAEGTSISGAFTLTSVGALIDLEIAEGSAQAHDLPIDHAATASFPAVGALAGFDASFATSDLRFDLSFQQPSGRVVELARDIAGNMTVIGNDLTFTLPELAGPFEGGAWLVALRASSSGPTTAQGQRLLLRLKNAGSEVFSMLAMPDIVSPTDGQIVPASGFTVQFSAPTGATYVQLDLRSEGVDERTWTAVVPATALEFAFVALPADAQSPLIAGRTWTLTVAAWRVDVGGYAGANYYGELSTFWQSLGAGNQGVRAGSSRTVTIATN